MLKVNTYKVFKLHYFENCLKIRPFFQPQMLMTVDRQKNQTHIIIVNSIHSFSPLSI